jgi:hypothetical protein
VLAAFAVTLAAGLAVAFGVRRFVTALLLNLWFIVVLGLASSFHHHAHITSYTWAQVLAWAGGAALWITVTFIGWLIRGREDRPQPVAELPGNTSRQKLTRPLIMVAMKPSLQQATLVAVQRLAGALIGGGAAALLLLIPASEHGLRLFAVERGLEVVALVLFMHGAAIRFWNYALYCGAIAAGVLILIDLPQPSNYAAEGYRLLWTLCGAGIGVLVMLLAGLFTRRTATAPPRTAPQPA